MSVDRSYLDQIAALEFKGVEWTREKILAVRDLLSPWNHNIALPHGVYTAACDDYYPAHRRSCASCASASETTSAAGASWTSAA